MEELMSKKEWNIPGYICSYIYIYIYIYIYSG